MREQFEKLPEIADSLSEHIYFGGDGFYSLVNWLNGAWYAFQEQQKKIDGALKELELLNYYRTGNSDNAIKILKGTDK